MIRVTTGSRLHFGLLSLPAIQAARHWGSVGLMIEQPGWELVIEPAENWTCKGTGTERAVELAKTLQACFADRRLSPCRIEVLRSAPQHAGLGSGTQLAMAVAYGLARCWGLDAAPLELAAALERGRRSALGIHGFLQGGFLADGGKGPNTTVAPLLFRADFPPEWPILLVLPRAHQGLHGEREHSAFTHLAENRVPDDKFTPLSRLVLLGLMPTLLERDFTAFSEALFEFNFKVGEIFAGAQGGVYAPPLGQELVSFLRMQGILGVGQSSWGPVIFAVLADDERARQIVADVRKRFRLQDDEVVLTRGRNRPNHVV